MRWVDRTIFTTSSSTPPHVHTSASSKRRGQSQKESKRRRKGVILPRRLEEAKRTASFVVDKRPTFVGLGWIACVTNQKTKTTTTCVLSKKNNKNACLRQGHRQAPAPAPAVSVPWSPYPDDTDVLH